ncbi:MAG: hypothetical protein IKS28_06990 [Clostridia bacterium]|nr:hypothetical protein [Clostridia bacterium]
MKKLMTLAVVIVLTVSMVFASHAFQWDDIDAVEGDHLWFFVGNAEFWSWNGLFQAGLQYGSADGTSLKLPASTDEAGKMLSCYYNQYKDDGTGWPASLDIATKTYRVYVIEYKSASPVTLRWYFEYAKQTGAFNTSADFTFPASEDWSFGYVAFPDSVEKVDRVLLTRLDLAKAESDVEIKRMGFFKSEDAARTYLKDVPATDDPTVDPAVPTADYIGVAVIVFAACAAAVVLSKKK